MPDPHGSLHRAVAELTIGTAISMREHERRTAEMGFAEVQQQFQVNITGTAGAGWGWASTTIVFEYPFHYAPAQRDPDFDRPHVSVGAEATPAVAVTACVTGWTIDPDNGAVIGAVVSIGVSGEGTYTGVVHLTFQGFAALGEDESPDVAG